MVVPSRELIRLTRRTFRRDLALFRECEVRVANHETVYSDNDDTDEKDS